MKKIEETSIVSLKSNVKHVTKSVNGVKITTKEYPYKMAVSGFNEAGTGAVCVYLTPNGEKTHIYNVDLLCVCE